MDTEDREEDDDRTTIVNNEVIEYPEQGNNFQRVISNHRPWKHLIEPAVLLLFVGLALNETVLPYMVELQYCRTVLNLTEQQCFNDQIDVKLKEEYEKFTSSFQLYRSVIEVVIPSFISFFVGPWSDMYGRKPLLVNALIGYSITYSLWVIGSSIQTLPPLYFLFFSVPLAFCGGNTTFILGMFCYICDVTTLKNRGARLGQLQATLFTGALIGTQLSRKLLSSFGYTIVFGSSSILTYFSLIYIYFFLDESIVRSQVELNSSNKNPFHLYYIQELYDCCYTKQTPKVRFTILLSTMIQLCSSIMAFGETGIMFLFLQRTLDWNLATYTTLSSFAIIVNTIGAFGGTWLLCYILKLDDVLVLSIAAFTQVLSVLVMIFAHRSWHIFFAKLLSCTHGITGPIVKSFLSHIIAKNELGKIFSLLSTMESATPLFGSLLYSTLFNLTISTMPGAIFYLSGFLTLFMLMNLAILVRMYVPDSSRVYSIHSQAVS